MLPSQQPHPLRPSPNPPDQTYYCTLQGSEVRELRFNSERLLRRYTEFVDTIITLEGLSYAADLIDQVLLHHRYCFVNRP